MKRSQIVIFFLALGLIGLSFFASRCDEDARKEAKNEPRGNVVDEVDFPRETNRYRRRRPKKTQGRAPLDTTRSKTRQNDPRDALELAIAAPEGEAHVVAELNALRNTPIADKLLRCQGREAEQAMERIRESTGIDPERDIDRVAITKGVVAISGFFEELKQPTKLGEPAPYGESGQTWELNNERDGPQHLARVGDNLILLGATAEGVQAAIDRAEGRGEVTPPMNVQGGSGEIYGTIGSAALQQLLGGVNSPVAARIAEVVDQGTIRVNVDDALAVSLDLEGPDAATAEDLSLAVGGALAGLRLQAAEQGDKDLARMLDFAKVAPGEDGKFAIDVAMPSDALLDVLGCEPDGTPRPGTDRFQPSDKEGADEGAPSEGEGLDEVPSEEVPAEDAPSLSED